MPDVGSSLFLIEACHIKVFAPLCGILSLKIKQNIINSEVYGGHNECDSLAPYD